MLIDDLMNTVVGQLRLWVFCNYLQKEKRQTLSFSQNVFLSSSFLSETLDDLDLNESLVSAVALPRSNYHHLVFYLAKPKASKGEQLLAFGFTEPKVCSVLIKGALGIECRKA